MMQETQKYATLDCKKVQKAKTVALKLFDDKYQKQDSFQKPKVQNINKAKSGRHTQKSALGFNYLESSKIPNSQSKSFQELIKQSKKILQEKQRIQDENKRRQRQKLSKKATKKLKRSQKRQGQQRKRARAGFKQIEKQEDITISQVDIQKFETQNPIITNLYEKINFIQNISQKCNIIEPFLRQIQFLQSNELDLEKNSYFNHPNYHQCKITRQLLQNLCKFQLEIKLLKQNQQRKQECACISVEQQIAHNKQIFSNLQIEEITNIQIQNMSPLQKNKFIGYYSNGSNMQQVYEDLENKLEQMEKILFQTNNISFSRSQEQEDENHYNQQGLAQLQDQDINEEDENQNGAQELSNQQMEQDQQQNAQQDQSWEQKSQ